MARVFGILLTEDGLTELEPVLKDYWSEGPIGKYLYCKEANPDRNYFHMVAECTNKDGSKFEADIYIPHRFIRIVVSGTDRKHIGFI
jgi:hypothetical protein